MKENCDLFIKAINPGYTVDGKSNVGEMIEISRCNDSDEMISLAGLIIDYTNSSGSRVVLAEFSEHTYLAGESILLRLASSPESELAAMTYTKTLAFKAEGVRLMRGEEVIDSVCWNNSEGCEKEFKSKEPTVLVRGEDGVFSHVPVAEYEVKFDPESMFIEEGMGGAEAPQPQCREVVFSEILSYYEETQAEQFVELHNTGAEQVLLNGCKLRYKNKEYPLTGVMKADGYYAEYLTAFKVTKNPNNVGVLELIDVDDTVVDRLEYPNGQKKGTSYAQIGYDKNGAEMWRTTFAVTPGEGNIYQEYQTCEEGKVINPETGNCVKVVEEVEKVCKEGYVLNPETGRCKKIVENTGATYSLEPEEYKEESSFVGVTAVSIVVVVAIFYVVFEFRNEIKKRLKKFRRR